MSRDRVISRAANERAVSMFRSVDLDALLQEKGVSASLLSGREFRRGCGELPVGRSEATEGFAEAAVPFGQH